VVVDHSPQAGPEDWWTGGASQGWGSWFYGGVYCNLITQKPGTRVPVLLPDGYPGTKIPESPSTTPLSHLVLYLCLLNK